MGSHHKQVFMFYLYSPIMLLSHLCVCVPVCVGEWVTVVDRPPESLSTRSKRRAASVTERSTVQTATIPLSYLFRTKVKGVFLLPNSLCLSLSAHTTTHMQTHCTLCISSACKWRVSQWRRWFLLFYITPQQLHSLLNFAKESRAVWSSLYSHPGLLRCTEVGCCADTPVLFRRRSCHKYCIDTIKATPVHAAHPQHNLLTSSESISTKTDKDSMYCRSLYKIASLCVGVHFSFFSLSAFHAFATPSFLCTPHMILLEPGRHTLSHLHPPPFPQHTERWCRAGCSGGGHARHPAWTSCVICWPTRSSWEQTHLPGRHLTTGVRMDVFFLQFTLRTV